MAKKMKCLYGDGCLVRLTDNAHEDKYIHAESYMPKCSEEDCPLYRKVYEFIIGDQKIRTPEIKAAERHVASYYHPPIRSRSTTRTRSRAVSYYRKAEVPPLDLRSMSAPEDSPMKSPPPNINSVSQRGTITVSPKRKRSRGEDHEKIQMMQSDIKQIKSAILEIRQMLSLKT